MVLYSVSFRFIANISSDSDTGSLCSKCEMTSIHIYMISLSVFDKIKKNVLAIEAIDVGVMRHVGGILQVFGMFEAGICCVG